MNTNDVKFIRLLILFLASLWLFSCGGSSGEVDNNDIPSSIVTSKTTSSVSIKWDAVNTADYYEVFRGLKSDGSDRTSIGKPTQASYDDTGLTAETNYYYWLRACKTGEFCSIFSKVLPIKTQIAPPSNLKSSNITENSISIKWDSSKGADYYEVFRGLKSDGSDRTSIGKPTGNSYNDAGLTAESNYYYWVKVCKTGGSCSSFSKVLQVKTLILVPSSPSNLKISNVTHSSVSIKWDAVNAADYYEVFRGLKSGSDRTSIGKPTQTSYDDTGLTAETNYYYWLRACKTGEFCSIFSKVLPIKTQIVPPSNLRSSNVTYSSVSIKWDAVNTADSYEVFRGLKSDGSDRSSLKSSIKGTSYEDKGLFDDISYYYWVKVCRTDGVCSGLSNKLSVKTNKFFIAFPKNLTLKLIKHGEIALNWDITHQTYEYIVHQAEETFSSIGEISNYSVLKGYKSYSVIQNQMKKITGIKPHTRYYFVVTIKSQNQQAGYPQSKPSNEVSVFLSLENQLNDTGLTWGGNYPSGNNNDCTGVVINQQDCKHGRDYLAAQGKLKKAGGGHAGFDFTKLASDGSELSIQNATWSDSGTEAAGTKWSCVRDNVTGLIWEVKTNDGTEHDKSKKYRWGGKSADTSGSERFNDWDKLVDVSNNQKLCGYSDWRVPQLMELESIINFNRYNPSIDTSYFPNTLSDFAFWSASASTYYSFSAWNVYFYYGYSNYSDYGRYYGLYVRLVRRGQ